MNFGRFRYFPKRFPHPRLKPGNLSFHFLNPRENIFIYNFLSFFLFLNFLPSSTTTSFSIFPKFQFSPKLQPPHNSTNSHLLPHLMHLSLSLPWPAKWPRRGTPIPSPICNKPPLIYINCISFTKSKTYINITFTLLFLFYFLPPRETFTLTKSSFISTQTLTPRTPQDLHL